MGEALRWSYYVSFGNKLAYIYVAECITEREQIPAPPPPPPPPANSQITKVTFQVNIILRQTG